LDGSGSATLADSGAKTSAAVAVAAAAALVTFATLSAGFRTRPVFGFSSAGETATGAAADDCLLDASAGLRRVFRAGFLAGTDAEDISKSEDTAKAVLAVEGEASLVLRLMGRFGVAGKTSGEGSVVGSVIGEEKKRKEREGFSGNQRSELQVKLQNPAGQGQSVGAVFKAPDLQTSTRKHCSNLC